MRRRDFLKQTTAGVGAAGTFSAAGFSKRGDLNKPNILLVLTDQWRAHALGFMKKDPVITPNLDEFAAGAAVLENSICTTPQCAPDRASLITGQYTVNHGLLVNGMILDRNSLTLGTECKKSGYQTAYVGKEHFGRNAREYGFVDYWFNNRSPHSYYNSSYQEFPHSGEFNPIDGWSPTVLTDHAVSYLKEKRNKSQPFAMVVSYGPPHNGSGQAKYDSAREDIYTYWAPDEYENLYKNGYLNQYAPRENVPEGEWSPHTAGYFGAVTSLDEEFGRLMKTLEDEGLADDTIVVFTADHGEMLGSKGLHTKGIWYAEATFVPGVIRWPGHIRPGRYTPPFCAADVTPTLLGLSGVYIPKVMDGVNFAPLLQGQPFDAPEYAFYSFFRGSVRDEKVKLALGSGFRGIIDGRYNYVVADGDVGRPGAEIKRYNVKNGELLYDLKNDPYQLNPMLRGESSASDAEMDRMQAALKTLLEKSKDPFLETCWIGRDENVEISEGDALRRYTEIAAVNDVSKGVEATHQ